jgi:hypothetical protein
MSFRATPCQSLPPDRVAPALTTVGSSGVNTICWADDLPRHDWLAVVVGSAQHPLRHGWISHEISPQAHQERQKRMIGVVAILAP